MNEIEDGGPAFPLHGSMGAQPGMSLRDYFAAKAMQGLVDFSAYAKGACDHAIAGRSYWLADEMLKERLKVRTT